MINSFLKKALAFGEVHGISDLTKVKLDIIKNWLSKDLSIAICLERDFDQQTHIEAWIRSGAVGNQIKERFASGDTSQFLDDQYYFFEGLSKLVQSYPDKVRVFCVDIVFNKPSDEASKAVLSAEDEDLFDSLRERFIVAQLKRYKPTLDMTDKVLWIAGNMHASKTSSYFPLSGLASAHIPTAAMWLHETYGLESIYTLPFSGEFSYQNSGQLTVNQFEDPQWAGKSFDGLKHVETISEMSQDFRKSYDWVYGITKTTPALKLSE